ncbi:MAG: response regulator transcription factor [Bacteroidia bacterium]
MKTERPPHILLVEDEKALGAMIKECLRENNFICKLVNDGIEAWDVFKNEKFDLCVFDVNLPKKDGFELAKLVRQKDENVPIVFLTANANDDDKLKGFEIGGDEYITKPFNKKELIARISAILKRTSKIKTELIIKDEFVQTDKLKLDFNNLILYIANSEKRLSSTEAELLKVFMNNQNHLIPRAVLQMEVWGKNDVFTGRSLDVYINKLRKLLKDEPSLEIINVHGSGFKLVQHNT